MIVTILLWIFMAVVVITVLEILVSATKPRQTPTPEVSCLAGGLLLVCAAPVVLVLIGSYSMRAQILAAVLAGFLGWSLVNLARDVHGVRGPRTAATTFLNLLVCMVELAALAMLLMEVSR